MLNTRPRSAQDVRDVVGWTHDEAALYLFSGSRLVWPLTVEQLQSMPAREGLAASVVVTPTGDLVAHFDLTMGGVVARLGRVVVNPALRGRGLASVVVALACAEAQRLGAAVVRFNVITANEPATRTYTHAGFVVVEGESSRPGVMTMERPVIAVKP